MHVACADWLTGRSPHALADACQAFSFAEDQERHIVAFRPTNVSAYNHHAIVHVCEDNAYFQQHEQPQLCSYHPTGAVVGTSDNPSGGQGSSPLGNSLVGCSGLIYTWAVGMGDFVFPPEAGFRTGIGHITKVILEIHYDNPGLHENVLDTMGFEAFYVNTLRPHDAASLIIGDPFVSFGRVQGAPSVDMMGEIPAETAITHREATCPSSCTRDFQSPVHVFGHFLHMHNYGHKIYTEHYNSSGTKIGTAGVRIDFWDNGFQQLQPVNYTVDPGDSLQTHCYWNTASHASEVSFGSPTSSEMCMDFLFYCAPPERAYLLPPPPDHTTAPSP